jgi:hypothetical protein
VRRRPVVAWHRRIQCIDIFILSIGEDFGKAWRAHGEHGIIDSMKPREDRIL